MLKDLEKKISPVLVVNNSSLKPYVELFDYAPENIYQQPLGSLVGFFEIKEYSEDSAYVVNFLTSVLKKEYYINPRRPVTESLDSALHKVNMALSELAKQGNIEWLGKLNAAICVLEKNSAHFSVAGRAKIFLYRSQGLTEVSEDLASDSLEPHPLKTFVNVSSGRMEKNDRLLITSEDIFHIFSTIELKKNFQRFDGDKFVQFLKTALSNQMEMIASIVVEMIDAEVQVPAKATVAKKKPTRTANVFSEKTFDKIPKTSLTVEESLTLMDTAASDAEYTDQKTGHIYVQGEASEPIENPKVALFWEATKEKIAEMWYLTKNETRRRYSMHRKNLARKMETRKMERAKLAAIKEQELLREQEEKVLQEIELEEKLAKDRETQRILFEKQEELRRTNLAQEKQAEAEQAQFETQNSYFPTQKKPSVEKQESTSIEDELEITEPKTPAAKAELGFQEKLRLAISQQQHQNVIDLRALTALEAENQTGSEADAPQQEEEQVISLPVPVHQQAEIELAQKQARKEARKVLTEKTLAWTKNFLTNSLNLIKNKFDKVNKRKESENASYKKAPHITPRFSKIKKSFSFFTFQQKMYTAVGLALVFIVPLFIVHFMNEPQKPTIAQLPKTAPLNAQPQSNEKNAVVGAALQTLVSRNDLIATLVTNVGPVAFTKNSLLMVSGSQTKEYPITPGEGAIEKVAFMKDLSLVLILTDQNKVISFSPVSLKFTDNNISLSGDAGTEMIGTYLTYLYVLDQTADQIYRYPRVDGGFGDKTNWLKNTDSLSSISDLTIDDSIYVVKNNQVIKYFQGQAQPLTLEASHTPIHYDKIYTSLDSTSLWILDKQNSRLVSFAKDTGNIVSQYPNDALKSGSSLSVDETNKVAYVTTPTGLISIALQ